MKQKEFNEWLDNILAKIDILPVAWNFNLYEENEVYTVEIVGTNSFDENEEDWACNEIFTSRGTYKNFYLIKDSWEKGLQYTIGFVKNYIKKGKYRNKLLETSAVACGFVGGDLEMLYIGHSKQSSQKSKKITMEKINSLPLLQLCSWITVYTDHEKADFQDKLWGFQFGGIEPMEDELNQMRKFLFNSLKG